MKDDTGLKEVWQQLDRLWDWLERRSPFTSCETVTVTFGTADTDKDIPHHLLPADPENIVYMPLRLSGGGVIYQDMSASRKPWQKGYVILRCTQAITADILLAVPRDE